MLLTVGCGVVAVQWSRTLPGKQQPRCCDCVKGKHWEVSQVDQVERTRLRSSDGHQVGICIDWSKGTELNNTKMGGLKSSDGKVVLAHEFNFFGLNFHED